MIVDEDGEEWVFCSDDFSVGDKVKVRFFTKGTDNARFDVEKLKKLKKSN